MVDEIVDRLKGRRRVSSEGAAEHFKDVFFDGEGTKWLCVAETRCDGRVELDFDDVEPVSSSKVLKRTGVILFAVVSTVAPIYWFFWRNS